MITLRLFKAAEPFRQIEERVLGLGEVTVGRDPSVDWAISDSRGDLSRRHCVLGSEGGRIWLRDTSTNGVFLGLEKRRAPRGEIQDIEIGATVYLGEYMIVFDPDPANDREVEPAHEALPAVQHNRAADVGDLTDASLLEAFCRGAGLEPSSFAGEDPRAVMSRLGVVYRQVVDDLSDLMQDRTMLKNSLQLERTSISARDNNPFKWAPPHRVAVEILKDDMGGFLKGAAAFKASFADLRRHGACLLAGSRATVSAVLQDLDPARLEEGTKRQPLTLGSRFEGMWRTFQRRHTDLVSASTRPGSGRIEQAFRAGYEAELRAKGGVE